ncbi:MAG: hypothetical protein AB7L76_00640 [Burkholderiaceae bacterium]
MRHLRLPLPPFAIAQARAQRPASNLRASMLAAAGVAAALAAFTAVGALTAPNAAAQSSRDAQQRYQDERSACNVAPPYIDRAACLREAGAALQASRRGQLTDSGNYEQNALMRCTPLPADERADCEARVRGQGTTRGSVAEGGIYRESVTTMVQTPEGWRPLRPGERP